MPSVINQRIVISGYLLRFLYFDYCASSDYILLSSMTGRTNFNICVATYILQSLRILNASVFPRSYPSLDFNRYSLLSVLLGAQLICFHIRGHELSTPDPHAYRPYSLFNDFRYKIIRIKPLMLSHENRLYLHPVNRMHTTSAINRLQRTPFGQSLSLPLFRAWLLIAYCSYYLFLTFTFMHFSSLRCSQIIFKVFQQFNVLFQYTLLYT